MMMKNQLPNGFIYFIVRNVKHIESLQIVYVPTIDHIDL